ncbi:thiol peroxidase [Campylobacter helveticus]|uniref:Thiol peroxidase n=1 Tax=Campylobacter helveticus TaxID=28898 RepID=A0AAX2UK74_9BACT|nr:thiol peroxidase [Campylobacter helveticus]ARE80035.1 lipid hydroperoxide peroxidase [Campylobacter helveticus]MCR2056034.1 thiol peroxidase [Campylobacter helveticus]MCR2061381.1 thiol peroxidase [Campylobacter helveticus]MCR2064625.1 thiol peroxidase [Campylobacter helveticus]TNB55078.1 thiol peroxidase [Campylobacter helveticus]
MSVNFKGNPVDLKGNAVEVGTVAPKLNLKAKDLSAVEIAKEGKTQIILSVPSLDTPVCATEAREFNQKIANFKDAEVIVVSMDLPFAMGRFCSTENIENITVASDFVAKEFGEKYGVLIANGVLEGLLARAVFVIKDGKIAYKELVKEITEMPNFEAVESFIKSGGGCCGVCGCR